MSVEAQADRFLSGMGGMALGQQPQQGQFQSHQHPQQPLPQAAGGLGSVPVPMVQNGQPSQGSQGSQGVGMSGLGGGMPLPYIDPNFNPLHTMQMHNHLLSDCSSKIKASGMAGLDAATVKMIFQTHYTSFKQSAASKQVLNINMVRDNIETRVINQGALGRVYVPSDASGKQPIAMQVALLDWAGFSLNDLIKQTHASTNHKSPTGYTTKTDGVMEVGDKVINKGMLDRALGNLQVLFAGAWDQLVAYEAVETLRNLARTAQDAFMEWSLFMQLMDEALADVGKRGKEFATNARPFSRKLLTGAPSSTLSCSEPWPHVR